MAERVFPGVGPVLPGRGLVASSFQYYLTGDESLRIEALSLTGIFDTAIVDVGARLWREDDRAVIVERERHVCNFQTLSRADYALPAGALLNLRLSTATASAVYGKLFVRAQLIRGAGASADVIGTLAQGYISPQNDRAWPGSPVDTMLDSPGLVSNPLFTLQVGPGLKLTVPTGRRYRVVTGFFQYIATAVAGNRILFAEVIDALGGQAWVGTNNVPVAPGGTGFYSFAAGQSPSTITASGCSHLPWPSDLELTAGMAVSIVAVTPDPNDIISGSSVIVREWMDL